MGRGRQSESEAIFREITIGLDAAQRGEVKAKAQPHGQPAPAVWLWEEICLQTCPALCKQKGFLSRSSGRSRGSPRTSHLKVCSQQHPQPKSPFPPAAGTCTRRQGCAPRLQRSPYSSRAKPGLQGTYKGIGSCRSHTCSLKREQTLALHLTVCGCKPRVTWQ